jgi:hypothetical protein
LAGFWASFDPEEQSAKNVVLRYRSAPWTDIVGYPEDDITDLAPLDDQPSPEEAISDIGGLSDSPGGNIIQPPAPTTHVAPFQLQQPPKTLHLPDPGIDQIMIRETSLPPPKNYPPVFVATRPSPIMDQVVRELLQARILQRNDSIVNAFRLFTVAKQDGSARPILDLSHGHRFTTSQP